MKTTLLMIMAAGQLMAADPISEALQKGLFEEEANHNLEAAIKAYERVIEQSQEQRRMAATALFRLGECYRKLGRTNDAAGQYQRLVREFPEQSTLAKLSQQNLSAISVSTGGSGVTTAGTSNIFDNTAAERAEIEKIKAMIKNSPDLINGREGPEGRTPLHNAAYAGYLTVARFLIQNKADLEAKDNSGETPLHLAASAGHKAMVELLLENGAEVNAESKNQSRPLHLVVGKGYRGVIESLIASKADVNASGNQGARPLHVVARVRQPGVAKLLLDHGADVNGRQTDGSTPLMTACGTRQLDTIKLLLEHGADVNVQNANGWSVLHTAVLQSSELLKMVLARKPDVDVMDEQGTTPLITAVHRADIGAVELLLAAGADPNKVGHTSPLLNAVQNINVEKTKLLLEVKADPNQMVKGITPLGWAMYPSNRLFTDAEKRKINEIIQLLRQHGAREDVAAAPPPVAAPTPLPPGGLRTVPGRAIREPVAQ